MKEKVLSFLANTPWGTAIKVGLGALLSYIVENIASFNFNPAVAAAIIAAVAVAINALNPQDTRYGKGAGQ